MLSAQDAGDSDGIQRYVFHVVPAVSGIELDRSGWFSVAQMLRWSEAARTKFASKEYTSMRQRPGVSASDQPRVSGVVASQMIRFCNAATGVQDPSQPPRGKRLVVQCEIGSVGNSTVEYRLRLSLDEELLAVSTCVFVRLEGLPGQLKPARISDHVRRKASAEVSEDRDFQLRSLASLPRAPPPGDDAVFSHAVIIRHSDEDINGHANHSFFARVLDDAKQSILVEGSTASPELKSLAELPLQGVLVSYDAEAFAHDLCEVRVSTSQPCVLDMWILRVSSPVGRAPGVLGRGRVFLKGSALPEGAPTAVPHPKL